MVVWAGNGRQHEVGADNATGATIDATRHRLPVLLVRRLNRDVHRASIMVVRDRNDRQRDVGADNATGATVDTAHSAAAKLKIVPVNDKSMKFCIQGLKQHKRRM
jgi:hypothetical protein